MQFIKFMADQILPEGLRFFPKNQNAPDFVVGTMIITPNDLIAWLKSKPELLTEYNGNKQLKLQLLNSKAGKLYAAVDTYRPQENAAHLPPVPTQSEILPF